MVKSQLAIIVLALVFCGSNAEARGRRMSHQQQTYTQYYTTPAPAAVPMNVVSPATNVVTTTPAPANGIVQTNAVVTTNATVSDGSVVQASGTYVQAPAVATAGGAQWKAEQSARIGSVQHLGGGFGGGSFEGNGFGATPQQAIQNCCFWGQRTPIEIGVARGANGYYATVFYR